MSGRIFAWLLVCNPPEQTAAQIAEALGASRSSLSMNLRLLAHFNMIEEVALKGERSSFYISRPGSLLDAMQAKIAFFSKLKALLREGMHIMESDPPEPIDRLDGVYDIYNFMENELAQSIERYRFELAKKENSRRSEG
ncbi:MAG TPA: MarR family transcriptional regulator [candidate division Zixibacteria bacterium]|nr:MarR family transcriptional regulator [candidate division Zixibacteria bacterium]